MKISFVLPSFNSVTWVTQAVQSCLEQTYKNIEVIVVDDASTDGTSDVLLSKWADLETQFKKEKLLSVIRNGNNLGRSASRNIGNAAATGDVICVLDADDLALPNRAKIVFDKFDRGCNFLYGSAVQIDACGRHHGEIRADIFNKDLAIERMENRIVHSTCAYSKEIAQKFKYRDGDISRLGLDDWAFQLEVAMSGIALDFSPNVLSAYRMLSSGVSQTRNLDDVKAFKKAYIESLKVSA